MRIESIAGGYATLRKTRADEQIIRLAERCMMISPDDFAAACMKLNRLIENGMPIEHFLGLIADEGETRGLYLLINDGGKDLTCVCVAA